MSNLNDTQEQYDMLIGNLNRMMVTVKEDELLSMLEFASDRLIRIFIANTKRIDKRKEVNK